MAIDKGLIGGVINALPMDRMISGPLNAMITAQTQASKAYADFLMNVCMDLKPDGNATAREIRFTYDETLVDTEGTVTGLVEKTMRIPLLAAITHPNLCIEEGSIDFELEVSQSEETKSSSAVEGSFAAQAGWGPFSVKISGRASHHREQTRKTDTRAKYSVHTTIKRQGPTEGLMRVIDFLTDAATKPVKLPDVQTKPPEELKKLEGTANEGLKKEQDAAQQQPT